MAVNYKRELEAAAKSMIIVHDPEVLMKMIVRMVVYKVRVAHATMLMPNSNKDSYMLAISRGSLSLRMPIGLARMDKDDPLIRLFRDNKNKLVSRSGVIVYKEAKKVLKKDTAGSLLQELLKETLHQMDILETAVCIPSYFRNELMSVLLLGKKKNNRKFVQEEINFFVALASNVAMAIKNAQLFKELEGELNKRQQLFIRTTIALAVAIEAKDRHTHGHTTRVTNLSIEIAKKIMQNNKVSADMKFLERLHIASLLHDIGKIGIPEHILNKDNTLTKEEKTKIMEHPLIGATILQPISELKECILGVKYHHERYDGAGYPEGLKGEKIPFIAAIISVADSFDTMTTYRPYRSTLSKEEAKEEIKRQSGKQFNPGVTAAFMQLYEEGKI